MPEVVMYSRPLCGYCELAKRLLTEKGVPYSEIDVSANRGLLSEMVGRSSGQDR